ncbi:MAG: protein kinase [Kofleriaceae bacterium]
MTDVPARPPEAADRTATLGPRRATASADEPGSVAPTARGSAPGDADGSLDDGAVAGSPAAQLPIDDPDRYELAGEHARGGLGRVVRAVDRRLGRTVAVKELQKRSRLAEALFVREALITARLEHPGIVPVHEAGRWPSGEPYYVMKFVSGKTLKEVVGSHPTVRSRLPLVAHVIAVADAVGYAHRAQVIHRDLKPSNVVVGEFGETVVVDWGLARDGAGDVPEPELDACDDAATTTSTVSGKVIGTPAYMAPEQARGAAVDARADVYALGAMLYEVLAGVPPYRGESPTEIVDRVLAGPPAALAEVAPGVPADLEAIVAKAMARDPAARYPDGMGLAADLRRYHSGQLVSAHHYRTLQLVRRWIARHRGAVAMAAIAAVVLVIVGALSVRGVVAERNRARGERAAALAARAAAEARQVELIRVQARTSLRRDPTATVAWLKASPSGLPAEVERERATLLAEAEVEGVARHVLREDDWVLDAAFSPDGRSLATASGDGGVRIYDVASGVARGLDRVDGSVHAVAWSPDGTRLAGGTSRGEVRLWRVAGGPAQALLPPSGAPVGALRWSSDGRRLLVESQAQAPRAVEVDRPGAVEELPIPTDASAVALPKDDWHRAIYGTFSGEVVRAATPPQVLARLPRRVDALAIDDAGQLVIAFDGATLWRLSLAGGPPEALGPHVGLARWITFAPDGRQVAIGGDATITVWDLAARTSRVLTGHSDAVYMVTFTADGRRLLSASDDGTARWWDLTTGDVQVLRGHDDDVVRARLSPDETTIATASLDRSARVWQPAPPTTIVLGPEPGPILHARLVGEDELVVTGAAFAATWSLSTRARRAILDGAAEAAVGDRGAVSTHDGRAVVVVRDDASIDVLRTDGTKLTLRDLTAMPTGGGVDDAGTRLVVGSRTGELWTWDLATGVGTRVWASPTSTPITAISVRRDGHTVFRVGDELRAWAPGGAVERLAAGDAACVHMLEYERGGERLLTWRCDGSVTLRRRDGVEVALELPPGHRPIQMTWSPDGAHLAGAITNRLALVWDASTGAVEHVLRGHTDVVLGLAYAPDGTRLATASYDRTIRVWDLGSGPEVDVHVLHGHTQSVDYVAWTRDGARLVSASRDGTARIWQAPAPGLSTATLAADLERASTAHIDEDDRPTT